jgi:hypothetical protein
MRRMAREFDSRSAPAYDPYVRGFSPDLFE